MVKFYVLLNGPGPGVLPIQDYAFLLVYIIPGYMLLYYQVGVYTPRRTVKRRFEIFDIVRANTIGYITMPYMLFVTAPYLLTSFTGNINNMNVIYLLTGGGPTNTAASSAAGAVGHTDLLITWVFKITQGTDALYYMASVIGIVIFIILATLTLGVYNRLGSNKNEGDMA